MSFSAYMPPTPSDRRRSIVSGALGASVEVTGADDEASADQRVPKRQRHDDEFAFPLAASLAASFDRFHHVRAGAGIRHTLGLRGRRECPAARQSAAHRPVRMHSTLPRKTAASVEMKHRIGNFRICAGTGHRHGTKVLFHEPRVDRQHLRMTVPQIGGVWVPGGTFRMGSDRHYAEEVLRKVSESPTGN